MTDVLTPTGNGKDLVDLTHEGSGDNLTAEPDPTATDEKLQAGKDPIVAPPPLAPPLPPLQEEEKEEQGEVEYVKGYPVIRNGESIDHGSAS